MNISRKQLAPYGFLLGILALVFAGVWYVLNRRIEPAFWIAVGLAIVATAVAVWLDLDRVRRFLSGRQARYGSNAVLLTLAVFGVLAVINFIAYDNPTTWDLTEDQEFSLAPETLALVENLEAPVRIIGFYTPQLDRSRANVEPLLDQYRIHSDGMVTYEFINPQAQPIVADQYGVSRDGTLVVVQGDRSEVVDSSLEREISSSIIRVSQPGVYQIAFLTGHGERDLEEPGEAGFTEVVRTLSTKNYETETLNLLTSPAVPDDVEVLVVAGPRRPLSPEELSAVSDFVEAGGSLLVMLDPTLESGVSVADDTLAEYLTDRWGITADDSVILDLDSSLPFAGIAVQYGNHPVTELMGTLGSYFPTARNLEIDETGDPPVPVALAQTGPNSWGETDLEALSQASEIAFDSETDVAGPLTVAASATDSVTGARVVVFGDSDFAANSDHFGLGNRELFINAVDWLAGQEQLIQLTPRQRTQRIITPPSVQAIGLIFLLAVVVVPGSVIGAGVAMWWRRRN